MPNATTIIPILGAQYFANPKDVTASLTTAELSELTGITTRNVARNLKTLQELGILERVGGRKKGYWKVNQR